MLAGTKAYHKKAKEIGYDKISINDILHKKKSMETMKR